MAYSIKGQVLAFVGNRGEPVGSYKQALRLNANFYPA